MEQITQQISNDFKIMNLVRKSRMVTQGLASGGKQQPRKQWKKQPRNSKLQKLPSSNPYTPFDNLSARQSLQNSFQLVPPDSSKNTQKQLQASKSGNLIDKSLDFRQSYEMLVDQLTNLSGGALILTQRDIASKKQKDANGKVVLDIEQRSRSIADFYKKKKQQIKAAHEIRDERQMKECTFKPKLVTNSYKQRKRSQEVMDKRATSMFDIDAQSKSLNTSRAFDEIIHDQQKYLMKKNRKLEMQRARIDQNIKQNHNVSKINKKSIQLLKKRKERLESQENYGDSPSQLDTSQVISQQLSQRKLSQKGSSKPPASKRVKINYTKMSLDLDKIRNRSFKLKSLRSTNSNLDLELNEVKRNIKDLEQNSKNFRVLTDRTLQNKTLQDSQRKLIQVTEQLKRMNNRMDMSHGPASKTMNRLSMARSDNGSTNSGLFRKQDKYLIQKFNRDFDQALATLPAINQDIVTAFDQQNESAQENKDGKVNKQQTLIPESKQLSKQQFKELIQKLGLVKESKRTANEPGQEDSFQLELWRNMRPKQLVDGQHESMVINSENLRFFIQVILRLSNKKKICDEPKNDSSIKPQNAPFLNSSASNNEQSLYGFMNAQGVLHIRPKEVSVIQKQFEKYHFSRLTFSKEQVDQKKKNIQLREGVNLTFKPALCQKSIKLSQEKKRKQQLKQEQRELRIFKAREEAVQRELEKEQQRQQQTQSHSQDNQLTLSPDNNQQMPQDELNSQQMMNQDSSKKLQEIEQSTMGKINLMNQSIEIEPRDSYHDLHAEPDERNQVRNESKSKSRRRRTIHTELYNLHKNKISKRDKSRDEYDFEKGKNECTFRPDISELPIRFKEGHQQNQKDKKSSHQLRQQASKERLIKRMREAQVEKARVQHILKTGMRAPIDIIKLQNLAPRKPKQQFKAPLVRINLRITNVEQPNSRKDAQDNTKNIQQMPWNRSTNDNLLPRNRSKDMNKEKKAQGTNITVPSIHLKAMDLKGPLLTSENEKRQDTEMGPPTLTLSGRVNLMNVNSKITTNSTARENSNLKLAFTEQINKKEKQIAAGPSVQEHAVQPFIEDQSQAQISMSIDDIQNEVLKKALEHQNKQVDKTKKKANKADAEDELESLNSDEEEAGVPDTRRSHIKDGMETINSKLNQFSSSRQSISLKETDEKMSSRQSIVLDKKQISPYLDTDQMSPNIMRLNDSKDEESPYKDLGDNRQNVVIMNSDGEGLSQNYTLRQQSNPSSSATPILFIDVCLGPDTQERIVVYEDDTADQLAHNFCQDHQLDSDALDQLTQMIDEQIQTNQQNMEKMIKAANDSAFPRHSDNLNEDDGKKQVQIKSQPQQPVEHEEDDMPQSPVSSRN